MVDICSNCHPFYTGSRSFPQSAAGSRSSRRNMPIQKGLIPEALLSGKLNVGGQAVIEGVMMRSPTSFAIAVRKPNGEIATLVEPLKMFSERSRLFKLPIVRGVITLISALFLGVRALNFSADMAMEEEEGKDKKKKRDGLSCNGPYCSIFVGTRCSAFLCPPVIPNKTPQNGNTSSRKQ